MINYLFYCWIFSGHVWNLWPGFLQFPQVGGLRLGESFLLKDASFVTYNCTACKVNGKHSKFSSTAISLSLMKNSFGLTFLLFLWNSEMCQAIFYYIDGIRLQRGMRNFHQFLDNLFWTSLIHHSHWRNYLKKRFTWLIYLGTLRRGRKRIRGARILVSARSRIGFNGSTRWRSLEITWSGSTENNQSCSKWKTNLLFSE